MSPPTDTVPAATDPAIVALKASFGAPSQEGFGSAVFHDPLPADGSLIDLARSRYQHFVGKLWERWGADAWLGSWEQVYERPEGSPPEIVAELRGIDDFSVKNTVPMILDVVADADVARRALAVVYDDPRVTELRVFRLGDGEAVSGLLLAGRRAGPGDAVLLAFLMD